MSLSFAIAAAVQGEMADSAFPENVEIDRRYDCAVRSTSHDKRGSEPYPVGDYVFLFPAGNGLIRGKSIPYIHTLADGRTYFKRATIEGAPPDLGPSFGFTLHMIPSVLLAFTTRNAGTGETSRLRGWSRPSEGRCVELEGDAGSG